jgi:hypothetical protein
LGKLQISRADGGLAQAGKLEQFGACVTQQPIRVLGLKGSPSLGFVEYDRGNTGRATQHGFPPFPQSVAISGEPGAAYFVRMTAAQCGAQNEPRAAWLPPALATRD